MLTNNENKEEEKKEHMLSKSKILKNVSSPYFVSYDRSAIQSLLQCVLNHLIPPLNRSTLYRDSVMYHEKHQNRHLTVFDCSSDTSIPIGEYIVRLSRYSMCSIETMIMAMYCLSDLYPLTYIHWNSLMSLRFGCTEPVLDADHAYPITAQNIHRMMLASFMICSKWWDDDSSRINNKHWAMIGGISKHGVPQIKELNAVERQFFGMMFGNNRNRYHIDPIAFANFFHWLYTWPIAHGHQTSSCTCSDHVHFYQCYETWIRPNTAGC